MNPATVIFLNGVSSAGKTSIAKVLQQTLPEPYLQVQLDSFVEYLALYMPALTLLKPIFIDVEVG
jgi:chloramphenicol 3-O-phosphotransferase